jgi:CheY-like chemotaxis protein
MKVINGPCSVHSSPDKLLHGRRILVVEDEILIAMTAQDMLTDAGAEVVVATRVSEAAGHLSASHPFDAAIIDLDLGEGYDSSVATMAVGRDIPVVLATGYSRMADLPPDLAAIPVVSKPYTSDMLVSALRGALAPRADAG